MTPPGFFGDALHAKCRLRIIVIAGGRQYLEDDPEESCSTVSSLMVPALFKLRTIANF